MGKGGTIVNTYRVVINKDISKYGGEAIPCENKMQALNIASAVARAFYYMVNASMHIFVVENLDTVKYHYEVIFEKNNKMILLYEGIYNNCRTIVKQVIK